ncbi:MAG: AAA family ATPase [Cyanobacteria bacterium J06633_8]
MSINALELAVETTSCNQNQVIEINLAVAEESIQQRAVLYDKEGDAHFDTISAYIKSIRGSDADAALYWLAKMIYAGENPRFIFRRLLIQASEDIGLADSQAIVIVNSCAQAFDRVGMPEGRYHLAQATLYLANAPKSNSVMGFFDALASVEKEKEKEIPNHLKDGNRDSKGFGHGAGYLYPHAYRDHWVEQQYLPQSLQGQVFYQPSEVGEETVIKIQVERRREAQLAAMVEGLGIETVEVLSYGEKNKTVDNWLQRTLGEVGENFSKLRDNLFEIANPQRHHLILDLNAKSGLLTWEAVRRVPEGGVYSWVRNEKDALALIEQSKVLTELTRPIVIHPSLSEIPDEIKFDRIIGRNALGKEVDKLKILLDLVKLLNKDGKIILAETIPRRSQKLYNLLDKTWLSEKLFQKIVKTEEAIYSNPDDAMVNWDIDDLEKIFMEVGLQVEINQQKNSTQLYITENLLNRWFTASENKTRLSYVNHLEKELTFQEIETVKHLFYGKLGNRVVEWETAIAILSAS